MSVDNTIKGYPQAKAADWWTYFNSGWASQQQEVQLKILISLLGATQSNGKQLLQKVALPIVAGAPKDSVDLSPLAGTIPQLIVGIQSGGASNIITATGFGFVAADDTDIILLSGLNQSLIQQLTDTANPAFALTGVGSTLSWDHNFYSAAYAFIINYNNPNFLT